MHHLKVEWEKGILRQDAVAARSSNEALAVGRLAIAELLARKHRGPVQDLLRVHADTIQGQVTSCLRGKHMCGEV